MPGIQRFPTDGGVKTFDYLQHSRLNRKSQTSQTISQPPLSKALSHLLQQLPELEEQLSCIRTKHEPQFCTSAAILHGKPCTTASPRPATSDQFLIFLTLNISQNDCLRCTKIRVAPGVMSTFTRPDGMHESGRHCPFLHDSTTVVALGTSQPQHRRGPGRGWGVSVLLKK